MIFGERKEATVFTCIFFIPNSIRLFFISYMEMDKVTKCMKFYKSVKKKEKKMKRKVFY